jgi:hypothetical protein
VVGHDGQIAQHSKVNPSLEFRVAGVEEGTIMALCGWKTRAMFDLYNIVNDADLAEAVAKRFNGKVTAKSPPSTVPA